MQPDIKLGLIGDNIAASRAPALHELCGSLHGLKVSYQRYIPRELGLDFVQTFERCRADGLAGINITLPYKAQVMTLISVDDPMVRQMGAVNTVLFSGGKPKGFNTDHSGFIAAYRAAFDAEKPGIVAQLGCGGVGKAVGFGLVGLGASEIRLVDTDRTRAEELAKNLRSAGTTNIKIVDSVAEAMAGADGAVNCTPLGMVGYGGSPCADKDFAGQRWAFDAVYTPLNTLFRGQALAVGATFISGFELFFQQGIHAFELFTGQKPQHIDELHRRLLSDVERDT